MVPVFRLLSSEPGLAWQQSVFHLLTNVNLFGGSAVSRRLASSVPQPSKTCLQTGRDRDWPSAKPLVGVRAASAADQAARRRASASAAVKITGKRRLEMKAIAARRHLRNRIENVRRSEISLSASNTKFLGGHRLPSSETRRPARKAWLQMWWRCKLARRASFRRRVERTDDRRHCNRP
jgi:hypothetical protein